MLGRRGKWKRECLDVSENGSPAENRREEVGFEGKMIRAKQDARFTAFDQKGEDWRR